MEKYNPTQIETGTEEEKAERYRYWAQQGASAIWNETVRLSLEYYGTPIGTIKDGPVMKFQHLPDGSRRILAEWRGPNALRHPDDQAT